MEINANYYIKKLKLEKHIEGGYFKEVYRSKESIEISKKTGRRNYATSIYFLLKSNLSSKFHKIKSDETWNFYSGSPTTLIILLPSGKIKKIILGSNIAKGEIFQYTILKNTWFAAYVNNKNSFSLLGCFVAPGFDFKDFKMANKNTILKKYPAYKNIINKIYENALK